MNTPMQPWKQLDRAVPLHVVQMLVIDSKRRLLLMHRSDKVRSAKNVWSLPSGLHDIGETMFTACSRELKEELNLPANPAHMRHLGIYENIAPELESPWHWIMSCIGVFVPDVSVFVNTEPDKHDAIALVRLVEFMGDSFWDNHNFHPSFVNWCKPQRAAIGMALSELVFDRGYPLI